MPELENSIAFRYLEETKLDRNTSKNKARPAIGGVSEYKHYVSAEKISLPRDWMVKEEQLSSLLQRRRSLRKYTDEPLLLSELAFLLWSAQGITAKAGRYLFRTAPSAGALYAVETYLCCERIQGLSPGLFHFDVPGFQLERLSDESVGKAVANACLGQSFMAKGAVTFLWTAVFRRNMCKYGHRGLRYILLDAGHICENLLLAAEAIGCGGCPVAAFFDDELETILSVDPTEEAVLYSATVGRRA